MGVVGGTRHYTGGGLGQDTGWSCPACGAENAGPIAQGCANCGAGRPGRKVEPPPPPPRLQQQQYQPTIAQLFAQQNPNVSIEDAFLAGYQAGIQAARTTRVPPPTPEAKMNRTLVAALELFRDEVLVTNPEEVARGEWLSAQDVTQLVAELRMAIEEAIHA